jgi:hypothetical protein
MASGDSPGDASLSRGWLLFGWLLLLGLVAWQGWQVTRSDDFYRPPLAVGDGPDYECLGYSLSRGQGFSFAWDDPAWREPYLTSPNRSQYVHLERQAWAGPTTARPPLYPLAISGIYRVFDRGPQAFAAVRLFSAACLGIAGGLSVMIAMIVAARTGLPAWAMGLAAVASGGLAMADQTIRTYAVDFLSEPLSLVLTTGMLLTAIVALRRDDDRWWLGVAMLVGLMILTRSLMIFWVPGLALLSWCSQPRNGWWRCLSFVLVVVLCLTPWAIRNVRWLEAFMPLGTQGMISLLGGYSEEALRDGNWHPEAERRLRRLLDTQPEAAERSVLEREVVTARAASREVRGWAVEHAADLPGLAWKRLQQHWGPFRGKTLLWRLAMLSGMLWLIVARCREGWWFLGLPVLSSLCVMLLYETGGRFLVPLYGLMYVLAGVGIAAWLARLVELVAASLARRGHRPA